jgi:hypothetical protein
LKELFESDASSILWSRAFSGPRPNCDKLEYVLNKWGCKHLLVGHTPQPNGISSECGHRVWRVDVGMSRAFGSKGVLARIQVLQIKKLARNKVMFTVLKYTTAEIAAASVPHKATPRTALSLKAAKVAAPKRISAVRLLTGRPFAAKLAMSHPRAYDASQGAYARV